MAAVISTFITLLVSTASPSNMILHNNPASNLWWIGFRLSNANLSCGGSISLVEITDNNHYADLWIPWDNLSISHNKLRPLHNKLCYFSYTRNLPFTMPLSVRVTKQDSYNNTQQRASYNVITSINGSVSYDFGSNFCEATQAPTTTYTSANPSFTPTKHPSVPPTNVPPTSDQSFLNQNKSYILAATAAVLCFIIISVIFCRDYYKRKRKARAAKDIAVVEIETIEPQPGVVVHEQDDTGEASRCDEEILEDVMENECNESEVSERDGNVEIARNVPMGEKDDSDPDSEDLYTKQNTALEKGTTQGATKENNTNDANDTGNKTDAGDDQKEVENWLNQYKMGQYYSLFMENGMNSLEYVKCIETTQDLEHIGVTLKGHQIVIMSAVKQLNHPIFSGAEGTTEGTNE
eukprot:620462_1